MSYKIKALMTTISEFRQHSSAQGRWLVPDPAGLAAVDLTTPQAWNRLGCKSGCVGGRL